MCPGRDFGVLMHRRTARRRRAPAGVQQRADLLQRGIYIYIYISPLQNARMAPTIAPHAKAARCLPPVSLFFSVFLDHLGIATVDFEFQQDPAAEYGVCESEQT